MTLKNLIDIIPGGVLDHVRIFSGSKRINQFYNFLDCEVNTVAPGLKHQHCSVSAIYDAYLDIFIDTSNELPF